jgi:cell division protein FtsA
MCTVLEARAGEIFEIMREKLEESGDFNRLPAGIVLTGGSSQLQGMVELGRSVLQMPVRVGAPQATLPISGLSRTLQSPSYSTTVGLLLWGLREDGDQVQRRFQAGEPPIGSSNGSQFWLKVRSVFRYLLPG